MLKRLSAPRFLRVLAASEIALGAALRCPIVPNSLAGVALTGFSGSLVMMYARTPSMHKPGGIWPSQSVIGVSMDAWMLGIGLGLVVESAEDS